MTDHEKRIRKALGRELTGEEWESDGAGVYSVEDSDFEVAVCFTQDADDAAHIAACNPSAIRALLAELDAMRGALNRIAAWHEGEQVTSSFDEPHAAAIARNALGGVIDADGAQDSPIPCDVFAGGSLFKKGTPFADLAEHMETEAARVGNCDYQWFCDAIKTAEDALSQITPTLQPQPTPDIDEAEISRMTERGAKAWAGVDAQVLREGGHPAPAPQPAVPVVSDEQIDAATRHMYHNGRPTTKEYRVGIVRATLALRPQGGGASEGSEAALDALADLCDLAKGGWDLPPTAVARIGALARKAVATLAMRPAVEPMTPLTDSEMEKGREQIFSTNNPYCPCDRKTFRKVAQWVEWHHKIGIPAKAGGGA